MKRAFTHPISLLFTALIICVAFLYGCANDSQQQVQTGDFKVEFLFEHDGCKVYRFRDGATSHFIYYTNCNGSTNMETGGKYSDRVVVSTHNN